MKVLAHRGASADAPENTLVAFAEAVRQGADGVELDVRVCGSGEVVVCHDERLDRLAKLDWEVRRTSLAKLRQADVGTALGFAPAFIPTLEEVIDALPVDYTINVELKSEGREDGGLSFLVAKLVETRGLQDRVVLSSFNPWCLWRVKRLNPRLRRGVLIEPDRSFFFQNRVLVPWLSPQSVHPDGDACTAARVAAWSRAGREVVAWTVDDPARACTLRDWGVRYCITNRPATIAAAVR